MPFHISHDFDAHGIVVDANALGNATAGTLNFKHDKLSAARNIQIFKALHDLSSINRKDKHKAFEIWLRFCGLVAAELGGRPVVRNNTLYIDISDIEAQNHEAYVGFLNRINGGFYGKAVTAAVDYAQENSQNMMLSFKPYNKNTGRSERWENIQSMCQAYMDLSDALVKNKDPRTRNMRHYIQNLTFGQNKWNNVDGLYRKPTNNKLRYEERKVVTGQTAALIILVAFMVGFFVIAPMVLVPLASTLMAAGVSQGLAGMLGIALGCGAVPSVLATFGLLIKERIKSFQHNRKQNKLLGDIANEGLVTHRATKKNTRGNSSKKMQNNVSIKKDSADLLYHDDKKSCGTLASVVSEHQGYVPSSLQSLKRRGANEYNDSSHINGGYVARYNNTHARRLNLSAHHKEAYSSNTRRAYNDGNIADRNNYSPGKHYGKHVDYAKQRRCADNVIDNRITGP